MKNSLDLMDKREIIEIFMKKGIILKPDVVEYLSSNEREVEKILEKINKTGNIPPLLSLEMIKNFLEEKKIEIEELKKETHCGEIISTDEFSNILIQRYEKIKNFFAYRMDLVNLISINKINEKTKKFSLIVMVRDVDRNGKTITVEDLTGEIVFNVKNKELMDFLVEDEVVGIVCEKNNGIEVVNILYPDIPLKRNIGKIEKDVLCLFCNFTIFKENYEKILNEVKRFFYDKLCIFLFSDFDLDEKNVEEVKSSLPFNSTLVLITNTKNLENVIRFQPPTFLAVERKIILLLSIGKDLEFYKKIWGKGDVVMLNLIKKRHLNPVLKMENLKMENKFIIDPVPDIFVVGCFDSPFSFNYKGTTFISCGSSEKIFWIVNLKTRESLKIDLI